MLESAPPHRAALLALLAVVRFDRGDARGSFEAASEARRIFEGLGGTVEGEALIRVAWAQALYATGQVDLARRAILAARERLLRRAAKIQNPEWRKSFLERIREHLRILARAGEWLT